ncbi:MAG: glycosyltransferase [Acidobacteriota bacterium]|nr:glycosyltransferase [Acidobacteriota bacterium]
MGKSDLSDLPLVSVVTPCLNMGRFLRATIESVLAQDYPRIEYIVMDGGSTDATLAILADYAGRLTYFSGPDAGTADAVNRGFRKAHGSILAFLNADDTYLPGGISAAVQALLAHPEAAAVYGNAYWVDQDGRTLGSYPVRPFDPALLRQECFICQPASFLRRDALEEAGMLDPALQYTYDYDLWIRLARVNTMGKIDQFVATSRMHRDSKTLGERRGVLKETLGMLQRHFGYIPFRWIDAYAANLMDGRDQFFEPTQPSIAKYLLSLLIGIGYNSGYPLRFLREWAAVMTVDGLVRRWHGFFHI